MRHTEWFEFWLETAPSTWFIGQIAVRKGEGGHVLRHRDETDTPAERSADWHAARNWVKYDDRGGYRPLKGEKNLRHGWELGPLGSRDLLLALDVFYPTAIANWVWFLEKRLPVTPFAETAGRQTGMYRIVGLTTPEQLARAVSETCVARCSKHRLWETPGLEITPAPDEIPLLCPEVCNLFVAACRTIIKGRPETE
jgi:hypothetical protein